MNRHDVVIIGGGLAGSACARELARSGIDAAAFERDRFPRDKVCGGFVSPRAVSCLERMGLIGRLRAAGAVEVTSAKVRAGPAEVDIRFEKSGLGISRAVLDDVLADHPAVTTGCPVRLIRRAGQEFVVSGESFEVRCRVVVDAAGKASRFTKRRTVGQFGVQYFEPEDRGSVLDFWFFEDGYGGAVSVEGGRSNFCFLVSKDRLAQYRNRTGRLVTGPVAYVPIPGEYIVVGDAAGMVDPFCGEGIRHALETGMLAAGIVTRGLHMRWSYEQIRQAYASESRRQWMRKRAVAAAVRAMMRHPGLFRAGLRAGGNTVLQHLWR